MTPERTRSERALYVLIEALLAVGQSPREIRAAIKAVAQEFGIETTATNRKDAVVADQGR